MMTRVRRILAWGMFTLLLMVGSGLLLADHLTPAATGAPGHVLPLQPAQTLIDRELGPMLAEHPGETGVLVVADGLDAFAARALSARHAGRSLDLQYYIWHDDVTGRLLGREAHAAAERGVRVRMLLDDLNAEGHDPRLLALDAHPNIEIRLYNPFRNRTGVRRLLEMVQRIFSVNHRMHNKAWIADGRVAVIGGRNIGAEYFSAGEAVNFRDLDLLLFGPAVADANRIFDAYWNSSAVVPLAALSEKQPRELADLVARTDVEVVSPEARLYLQRVEASPTVHGYRESTLAPIWTRHLGVVADPPLKWQQDDRRGWLVLRLERMLHATRDKALLISPYFVPGDDLTRELGGMVTRGAHVGVITNSLAANDVVAVHAGYRNYRPGLLAGGVALYETRADPRQPAHSAFGSSGASLHTKAFMVDDARGFIGSFNLDPRSADLNTEMGVLFDDPRLAAAVREEFLRMAAPAASYWVFDDTDGDVRWLDRGARPPRVLDEEPDASLMQRATAWALSWLPIESQL